MNFCCGNPECPMYQLLRVDYPRCDCPLMCDDGCIYGDDCAHGTPLPANISHVHENLNAQEPVND